MDLTFRIGFGILFYQQGTVSENVLEYDFMPLSEGTMRCCSLTDLHSGFWRACKQMELGECRARGCSVRCLEFDVSCNWWPVQWDKQRCDMSQAHRRPVAVLCSGSSEEVWLCVMEVQPAGRCSSPAKKWQGPGREVVQHGTLGRAWSSWCCAMQTCIQCGLLEVS